MKNKALRLKQKKLDFFIFFTILILGVLIRFYRIDTIPPPIHIDEAFMGQSAIAILERSKNLLETYFSSLIVANIFTAFFIELFGMEIITLRIQAVLFGITTNVLLYFLVKDLFSKRLALICFFIGMSSHLAIAYSRINIPPIQGPFFLILTLYILNLAIKRKNDIIFFLGGITTALSLYFYTGARIAIVVGLAFLCIHFRKLRWRNWFYFFSGLLLIALPLAIYISGPNNYLQRESEVTLFNKPHIFYARWGTTDIPTIFYQQFKTNFLGFFNIQDFSNQYGNGILIDKLSSALLLLFFVLFFSTFIYQYRRIRKDIRNLSFFVAIFLLIISLVSLTESPPLSTRLLILYPLISLFIALTIDKIYLALKKVNVLISVIFMLTILITILVLNLKIYFYDYIIKKNAYYSWIEPASSIGLFIQKSQNEHFYLLSNPHTYGVQPILSVLTYSYHKKITDITNVNEIRTIINRDPTFTIIIPLTPKEAINSNFDVENLVADILINKNLVRNYYWGIPCKNCATQQIFLTVSK